MRSRLASCALLVQVLVIGACAGEEAPVDATVSRAWELDDAARRGSVGVMRDLLSASCRAQLSDGDLRTFLDRFRPEPGHSRPPWVDARPLDDGKHVETRVVYHYGASSDGGSLRQAFHPATWETDGSTWWFSDCDLVRDPSPTVTVSE